MFMEATKIYLFSALKTSGSLLIALVLSASKQLVWELIRLTDGSKMFRLYFCAITLWSENHARPIYKLDIYSGQFLLHALRGLFGKDDYNSARCVLNEGSGSAIFIALRRREWLLKAVKYN